MIDLHSTTWRAVAAHCEQAIDAARSALEQRLDAENTTFQRGRLAALREVLALSQPRETEKAPDGPLYG